MREMVRAKLEEECDTTPRNPTAIFNALENHWKVMKAQYDSSSLQEPKMRVQALLRDSIVCNRKSKGCGLKVTISRKEDRLKVLADFHIG